ncbi:hypothetical protein [Acinetobacter schindleri]|uniref:hypothetical protein n=1 Tax=Acinetobacter schindleri TaxID=108981 RepID=UPI0040459358
MKIKILTAFFVLMSSTHSYSNEKILIPPEYKSFWVDGERGYNVNRDFFNNTEQVVFMFVSNENVREDVWFTNCFNDKYMGIDVFSCITQNKKFTVLTNDNGKSIIFNLDKSAEQKKDHKVNYKIDNSPIRTLEHSALLPGVEANFLMRDLIKGKKIIYSWENSNGYSSETINLVGFKESMDFATKMLKLNSP